MLVLTRRIDECIIINDDHHIEIKVLGVQGRQVKLGIKAPATVSVHREEIFHRIQCKELEEVVNG